jgi:Beta-lactamase enzyme family
VKNPLRVVFLAACMILPFGARAELAGLDYVKQSAPLYALLQNAADAALRLPLTNALKTNELAVTLIDLTHPGAPVCASIRGAEPIYPASVVKLFYLVAAHRWLEDGRLSDTPELRRAMHDMIVDSYNEATHYVVDVLTGTTSGPELTEDALATWHDQRQVVNRYFTGLGYRGINADKKPWCEGPYGREIQAMRRFQPGRNQLTTDATARLLYEIAVGKAVNPTRSDQMLDLLRRDPFKPSDDPDDQAHGFSGLAFLNPPKPGVKLWSKAGWTSETRHDAAIVELPGGRRFVLVVFTVNHANARHIIPTVVRVVAEGLAR